MFWCTFGFYSWLINKLTAIEVLVKRRTGGSAFCVGIYYFAVSSNASTKSHPLLSEKYLKDIKRSKDSYSFPRMKVKPSFHVFSFYELYMTQSGSTFTRQTAIQSRKWIKLEIQMVSCTQYPHQYHINVCVFKNRTRRKNVAVNNLQLC